MTSGEATSPLPAKPSQCWVSDPSLQAIHLSPLVTLLGARHQRCCCTSFHSPAFYPSLEGSRRVLPPRHLRPITANSAHIRQPAVLLLLSTAVNWRHLHPCPPVLPGFHSKGSSASCLAYLFIADLGTLLLLCTPLFYPVKMSAKARKEEQTHTDISQNNLKLVRNMKICIYFSLGFVGDLW